MEKLILHPTETAQWYALINEAEATRSVRLNEELESYLVFLLMRFTQQSTLVTEFAATELLEGLAQVGRVRFERLRHVGDQCLLVSGLFPGQAERRHVTLNYFVRLGQTAYDAIATDDEYASATLYNRLAHEFVTLTTVLSATRLIYPRHILDSTAVATLAALSNRVGKDATH